MQQTPMTRVLAMILAAPLTVAPVAALAEQHTNGQSGPTDSMSEDQGSSDSAEATSGESAGSGGSGEASDAQSEQLIATVGDTEITTADVEAAINSLPPQMRQQMPPETLARMAVDQLVLREVILQEARSENLSEDPEVQRLTEEAQSRSEDDAMVQVYVQRALDGAVTDEAVQETYDRIASQTEQEVPPLDAVRPQIEQQLRQERLGQVRDELVQGVEITYYGPDGQPIEASTQGGASGGSQSGASGSGDGATSQSGSGSSDGATSDSSDGSMSEDGSGSSSQDGTTGNN